MKLLWVSNAPFSATGYGVQTKLFTQTIHDLGHKLAISAFYGLEGGLLNWNGIEVYPKAYHPFGQDVVGAHARHTGAEVAISLMDAWVCDPRMYGGDIKWIPWFPIDMEPLSPAIANKIQHAWKRITFSKFGNAVMDAAGLEYSYIPHGVDTRLYRPIEQKQARDVLGIPHDAYVIGMIAANKGNPSRKAFYQQILAFKAFKKRHPDAVLYLHTNKSISGELQGINLPELIEAVGLRIGFDVMFAAQYELMLGFGDEYMSNIYNAMDCLSSVSMGEGFGVPILEAQACGTPVIVGDWTAMPELCFWGQKVSKDDASPVWTPLAAWQWDPHVAAIDEAYERQYNDLTDPTKRAVAWTAAQAYDHHTITVQYWKPYLEKIESELYDEGDTGWKPKVL